ncbi:CRE-GST-6 protein [Caenorhabditis remanei]|uniref:glutathione transferase n=1 Tax=Caenorhabditis remanei TaxID=31234 RepID=E3M488_CAERE|nr:CRE-GST-6 protein [Caenorhabditis remanei]
MVHYKLIYFPLRARAEIARQIFAYAGKDYNEEIITFEKWPALKNSTPFGQLPVLEVDGKPLGQSYAIARYLAKEFGIAGKNEIEEAEVDAIADQFKDYLNDVVPYLTALSGLKPGDVNQLRTDVFVPNFKKHFAFFENILSSNPSGLFVGNDLTWVDLLISQHVQEVLERDLAVVEEFKKVLAHRKKVQSLDRIKQHIARRPEYPF